MQSYHKNKTLRETNQIAAAHREIATEGYTGRTLKDNRSSTVAQTKKNTTGLPDTIKSGIENLSGHSLDDVKVHYNSSKPAQLNAHAYAQGKHIHIASGQEKHLPHEAWHIVQQKQGRVRPTKTVSGAKINDDSSLEKEADVMGEKALKQQNVIQKKQSQTHVTQLHTSYESTNVMQLKKNNAQKFIKDHNLGIGATFLEVQTYVQNSSNDKKLRLGLLNSWNYKQTGMYKITKPDDLLPKSTDFTTIDDLANYDSDEDDETDLDTVMKSKSQETMDLQRTDSKRNQKDVSVFNPFDAIRFGRQVNKRDSYHRLPMITNIGGHYIELDNPGTKDIYATPLEGIKKKKRRTYKRQGTSSDYNWRNLALRLDEMGYTDSKRRMINLLRFYIKRGGKMKMDSVSAEAIAAIGADLMKGSKGGRHYLYKTIRAIKKSKKSLSFSDVFAGTSPMYKPAITGGRALVTKMNAKIEEDANRLLNVNNCLINAIALAAHNAMPNLGQLMRIREQIGSYGNMLIASPRIIQIIRQVLNIQNPITIVYQGMIPPENFAGHGHQLTIYHVNGNHFTHQAPNTNK
ncbi:eCIS core domain-containing protein [Kordia zhangzhouensis]|uniref:eCIS core domain-containing protein n=1 Tax=Kordia zhangzhouensis TaxID=1620405 RepID=UPI0007ED76BB|nr:DUF4157 domain-containing protein [Kordia zhangzhouensis]